AVKVALFKIESGKETWLSRSLLRIRQRDPIEMARVAYDNALEDAKLRPQEVNYVATTGEGESVPFHTGHFYSMTSHARGAIHLDPQARAALDIGALHGRAISIDERGKVLSYKMTSQCASGSGQFLENIARYLRIQHPQGHSPVDGRPALQAAQSGGSDWWLGDGDRGACARQRARRRAGRGYLPYQGHEGRRSQPSRFDLRRRDRS